MNYLVLTLNTLGVGVILSTAIMICMSPSSWAYSLIACVASLFTLSAWRLQLQYLGLWPAELASTGAPASAMALANVKSALLLPVVAAELWYSPSKHGLYIAALTFLIASTAWSPIYSLLSYQLLKSSITLTPKGERELLRHSVVSAFGNFISWAGAAILLYYLCQR